MCPCSYHSYDVFLTKEPNAYEAMSLVHSRVRRVVFGIADTKMGGLGGGIVKIEDPYAPLRRKVINKLKDLHPNS